MSLRVGTRYIPKSIRLSVPRSLNELRCFIFILNLSCYTSMDSSRQALQANGKLLSFHLRFQIINQKPKNIETAHQSHYLFLHKPVLGLYWQVSKVTFWLFEWVINSCTYCYYASPTSGEAYRNRRLTTNFELWVEIFFVCRHVSI